MKQVFFLLLFLTAAVRLCAQDFSKVDAYARSVSFPEKQDLNALAKTLTQNFKTEQEKARALFVWVAHNIRYDVQTFEERGKIDPEKVAQRNEPEDVLKRKKGVCMGYANLFDALCEKAGLKSITVHGLSKNDEGVVSQGRHAWNLVRIDGQWRLMDLTWAAGDVDIDKHKYIPNFKPVFFETDPAVMIQDHFPFDPLFQLLPVPYDFEQFKHPGKSAAKPPAPAPTPGFAHLKDSLNAYYALDPQSRELNTAARMIRVDANNGEAFFLLAETYFNEATDRYNEFVTDYNNQVRNHVPPSISGTEQSIAFLEEMKRKLELVQQYLGKVSGGKELTQNAARMRSNLTHMTADVKAQIKANKDTLKELNGRKSKQAP